jgi:excisionase family DNA binding protein
MSADKTAEQRKPSWRSAAREKSAARWGGFVPPKVMTVLEVADSLDVSEETVRTWLQTGALGCFRVGEGYRIPVTTLDEFLTAQVAEYAAGRRTA